MKISWDFEPSMIEALQKIPVTSRWLKTRKRPTLTSGEQRLPRGVFPGAAAAAPEKNLDMVDTLFQFLD